MACGLKFLIIEEEGLCYLFSANKGADQLQGYSANTEQLIWAIVCHIHIKYSHFAAHLSRVMRKLFFCICENRNADQLHGNRVSTCFFATQIVQSL